nr:hypothetical protein GCM10020093_012640 [Planobispora longispora]
MSSKRLRVPSGPQTPDASLRPSSWVSETRTREPGAEQRSTIAVLTLVGRNLNVIFAAVLCDVSVRRIRSPW